MDSDFNIDDINIQSNLTLGADPMEGEGNMYARVITAQVDSEGFDGVIHLAKQQLPNAREQPGFKGYSLLTDAESGKIMIISLWETQDQMEAVAGKSGIREEGIAAIGLTKLHLETYEIAMNAKL